jgi:hypothetical protein
MEMTTDLAYSMIRTLGSIFADALEKAGKGKPDVSPLMHGIAAYHKLNLKGEDAKLDEAYNIVTTDMMEAVRGSWKAA